MKMKQQRNGNEGAKKMTERNKNENLRKIN